MTAYPFNAHAVLRKWGFQPCQSEPFKGLAWHGTNPASGLPSLVWNAEAYRFAHELLMRN